MPAPAAQHRLATAAYRCPECGDHQCACPAIDRIDRVLDEEPRGTQDAAAGRFRCAHCGVMRPPGNDAGNCIVAVRSCCGALCIVCSQDCATAIEEGA